MLPVPLTLVRVAHVQPEPLLVRVTRALRRLRWKLLCGGRPRLVELAPKPRPQPLKLLA
jgi:hypothetical protein